MKSLVAKVLAVLLMVGACYSLPRPVSICRDGFVVKLLEYRYNLFYEDFAIDLHGNKVKCVTALFNPRKEQ